MKELERYNGPFGAVDEEEEEEREEEEEPKRTFLAALCLATWHF